MDRNVKVIEDFEGIKTVLINDVFFRGKRAINWDDVEEYLQQFIGKSFIISQFQDLVYIGSDLPDEYAHSEYTRILRGSNAKAKANAVQGLPEIIETAYDKKHTENHKDKHKKDAKYGWYRYESRFALPVFDNNGELDYYNVFQVVLVVRHGDDGRMYLYDIMNIKKETSTLFQFEDLTQ